MLREIKTVVPCAIMVRHTKQWMFTLASRAGMGITAIIWMVKQV